MSDDYMTTAESMQHASALLRKASKEVGVGGVVDLQEVARSMPPGSNPDHVIGAAERDWIFDILEAAPSGSYHYTVMKVLE